MSYIFALVFLVLGLIDHDSTLFLVAGLFSMAGAIEIIASKIPRVDISKIHLKKQQEVDVNTITNDFMKLYINEIFKRKNDEEK